MIDRRRSFDLTFLWSLVLLFLGQIILGSGESKITGFGHLKASTHKALTSYSYIYPKMLEAGPVGIVISGNQVQIFVGLESKFSRHKHCFKTLLDTLTFSSVNQKYLALY